MVPGSLYAGQAVYVSFMVFERLGTVRIDSIMTLSWLTTRQARAVAHVTDGSDGPLGCDVTGDGDMLTLRDAVDVGVIAWTYNAAKQRLSQGVGTVPEQRGRRGKAHLYARADLEAWVLSSSR